MESQINPTSGVIEVNILRVLHVELELQKLQPLSPALPVHVQRILKFEMLIPPGAHGTEYECLVPPCLLSSTATCLVVL